MNGLSVCERMHQAAAPVWASCLHHPFVTGLGDGTLAVEKFRYYMIQDYLYLLDYAKVFALGVVKAREPELMRAFARSVDDTLNGEMNIHRAYMKRLGISLEQAAAARPAQDNLSYTSYMLSVAHAGTTAEITAAILACSWSYAEIGRELAKRPGALEHPLFGEWIQGYSSEEYVQANGALIEQMNRLAEGLSPAQTDRLTEIFVRCSRYELAFWDMAWEIRA